jgi:hypothetical protein
METDQFSRETGVALALSNGSVLCLSVDALFSFAPMDAREKGCFSRSEFQAARTNVSEKNWSNHSLLKRVE